MRLAGEWPTRVLGLGSSQNPDTTCYVVDKGRDHGVVLSLLGQDFDGVLQSDCFLAYLPLPYKKAKCLAHILKALKELEALLS